MQRKITVDVQDCSDDKRSKLPMEDIAHLKKESWLAAQERDSLIKANAEAKAVLR